MASRVPVGIAGTGSYVPERVVPNSYFEDIVDTSDEWIVQRTGIRERRFVADDQATLDLAHHASVRALEDAQIDPADLDLIILGTLTPDFLLPATSCQLQDKLGAKKSGAFDCNAACTGFVTAINTGEAFIAAGRARRVLAVGAEALTRFVDFTDRSACILFGDAAGAVVLTPHEECRQGEILETTLGADGSGFKHIHMEAGGSRNPATAETVERRQHFIRVHGRDVFRFAVARMGSLIEDVVKRYGENEIGLIVPHQVNRRIIDAALDRIGMTDEKVVVNIQHYANTSSATVPLALDEARRQDRIPKGKVVLLVAFGAGLTWGSTVIRW
ncbi:MAG: ketoacyl-ACP synthase III [Planctomycetota bacterium]|nr:ketoacyl-ACP synthase III [Planctomycetota bacterium]